MEQEIIEGNKLIAEFMGAEVDNRGLGEAAWLTAPKKKTSNWIPIDALQYHSSWDWLMGVVEKIESLGFFTLVATSRMGGYKYYMNIATGVGIVNETMDNPSKFMGQSDSKIDAVYKTVIEFIKWYNNQKQTNGTKQ